jgi:hypothetical protein
LQGAPFVDSKSTQEAVCQEEAVESGAVAGVVGGPPAIPVGLLAGCAEGVAVQLAKESDNSFVRFAGQAVELISDVDNARKVSKKAHRVLTSWIG